MGDKNNKSTDNAYRAEKVNVEEKADAETKIDAEEKADAESKVNAEEKANAEEKTNRESKVNAKEKANYKETNKRKRIVFAVILLAALAYFLFYTGTHKDELSVTENYVLSYEPASGKDAEEIFLENDKEYKSLIIPEQDGVLTNVTVRMKKVKSDFTGNLVFRIYGDEENEIIRMDVSKEDLLADPIDYVSVFNMTVPVSQGEKIWVSWMVTGNEGSPTCLYLYDNEEGEVILDGGTMSGKSLQQNGYMYASYVSSRWMIIVPVIIPLPCWCCSSLRELQ